jgi:hypothetical protein
MLRLLSQCFIVEIQKCTVSQSAENTKEKEKEKRR